MRTAMLKAQAASEKQDLVYGQTLIDEVKAILASKPKRVALLIWRDGARIFFPVNLG